VGNLAYVGSAGLRVIDVSNPTAPVELSALFAPAFALDVEVVGDLAYVTMGMRKSSSVSNYSGELRIIDVSNPIFPVELGALDTEDLPHDVEVVSDLAYVAGGRLGLRVVDVSDPTAPVELGALRTPDMAFDVEVVDGLAYVADGDGGLRIIDFGPEYAPSIEVDLDIKPGSEPNAVNPLARGILPVAILGSDTFDVADVDSTTLAFGPGEAAPLHSSGGHAEDVNDDGYIDWVSHYRIEEVAVAAGDTELCLTGETLDGIPFEGCDAIVTVPYVGERRRARVNRQR